MKWIKKNWKYLALGIVIIILFTIPRVCQDLSYRNKIKGLDKEVADLNKKNVTLFDEAQDYIKGAELDKEIIEGLKAELSNSKLKIEELRKEEAMVEIEVATLPPSAVVEDIRTVLDCAEVELTDNGILLSELCARITLVRLKGFSLVRKQLNETTFALSLAEEALHFSERRSLKLFGALWKFGDMVRNYKTIIKAKDKKFELAEGQRRKSWFNGLFIGFTIGTGITIIIVLIIPLIKLLI